jgi:hypothetical protein
MRERPTTYTRAGMHKARAFVATAVLFSVGMAVAALYCWQQGAVLGDVVAVVIGLLGVGCIALAVICLPASGLLFELEVRRKFRAVCRSKGLAEKVSKKNGGHKWVYPSISRIEGNRDSFRGAIGTLHGHSMADWDKAGPALGLADDEGRLSQDRGA